MRPEIRALQALVLLLVALGGVGFTGASGSNQAVVAGWPTSGAEVTLSLTPLADVAVEPDRTTRSLAPEASDTAPSPTAPVVASVPQPTPTPTPAPPVDIVDAHHQTRADDAPVAVPSSPREPTATPSPTATPAPPAPAPLPTLQERGQEALGLIAYDWNNRLPGWRIDFLPGREGYRGLTFTGEARIEIYLRDNDDAWSIARVIAHELGHAVDVTHNDSGERLRWLEIRGITTAVWWPGSGVSDFSSGAGDFAECWATWQMGSGSLSQISGGCTEAQLALVAELS